MADDAALQVMDLRCNGCGAPLNVPQETNFVTCQHCRAQLVIKRNDSAAYTEVLQAFTREAQELRGQVERLSLQNELTALDQAWQREREQYLVYVQDRRPTEPSTVKAVAQGVVFGLFGVVFSVLGVAVAGPFGLFGIVAVGVAIVGTAVSIIKAQRFEAARSRYQQRRRELLTRQADGDSPSRRDLDD